VTDAAVAAAVTQSLAVEHAARATWAGTEDLPEKDSALIVLRHATALRKSLESWIGRRALRAQLSR